MEKERKKKKERKKNEKRKKELLTFDQVTSGVIHLASTYHTKSSQEKKKYPFNVIL